MLLRPIPLIYRHRAGTQRRAAAAPAPVATPVLIAASCDESPTLTLVFDRPVDVSAMDVAAIRVDNGLLMFSYVGHGTPTLASPTTVDVALSGTTDYDGPGVILDAPGGAGIVAAGDGAAWAGVDDLALPFP
jgi:hypothetical protein